MGMKQTCEQRRSRRWARGHEKKERLVDTLPRLSCTWWGHLDLEGKSSLLCLSTGLSTPPPTTLPPTPPTSTFLLCILPNGGSGCLLDALGKATRKAIRGKKTTVAIIKDDDGLLVVGIFVFSSCSNKVWDLSNRNASSQRPGG